MPSPPPMSLCYPYIGNEFRAKNTEGAWYRLNKVCNACGFVPVAATGIG